VTPFPHPALRTGQALFLSDTAGPTANVSHATSVPLKAAQDALSAKRYADAIAKLKEAEANPHGLSQISTLRLEMRMAETDDNLHRKIVFGGARVIAWFLSIVSRIQRKGARENWGNSRFTNASRCETPSNRSRAARLGCRKADGDQGRLGVCAVQRRRFPVGASPTRQMLQPEATGATVEVTKRLKPSGNACHDIR
jgi:hypothetical protein